MSMAIKYGPQPTQARPTPSDTGLKKVVRDLSMTALDASDKRANATVTSPVADKSSATDNTLTQQKLSMSTVSLAATTNANPNSGTANATSELKSNAEKALKTYNDLSNSSTKDRMNLADARKAAIAFDTQASADTKMTDKSSRDSLQQAAVAALSQSSQTTPQMLSLLRG